jgi:hypothetical protein
MVLMNRNLKACHYRNIMMIFQIKPVNVLMKIDRLILLICYQLIRYKCMFDNIVHFD